MAIVAVATAGQSAPEFERPPINYSSTAPKDGVARLLQRIASKEIAFTGSDSDILHAVLRELGIPVESQIVVFSKTSLQGGLIRPDNPRALYFSDSLYVGWVPGGLIEVAAIDPELGPVFYAFDPQDGRDARRTFVRESSCLRCHGGTFSREIPGLFVRSVATTDQGELLSRPGTDFVDDETPFERRWGGWYVTGYAGTQSHRGNAFALGRGEKVEFTPSDKRPTELSDYFDPAKYLTTTSDVVALLVFQHQLAMHNSLTRAAHRSRRALEEQRTRQKSSNSPVTAEAANATVQSVLATAADDVVDHLLFRNAATLPDGVTGAEAFRRAFRADARRTVKGDSLKDLSLRDRLFANRCSFLIYSDSFAALPSALRKLIFERLHVALRGDIPPARFAYLEKEERRRILDVLHETLPEARQRFQALAR